MNSRPLMKGRLGSLFVLLGIASVAMPGILSAALPSDSAPASAPAKDSADDTSNPYAIIVERNIFHLTTPPPPPEPEKPKVELPVVKISGFVNIGNTSKVLFVAQPKDKKEGPLYYSLAEGEKSLDSKLELLKIAPAQDSVEVMNDGVRVTLTVTNDSYIPSPAAAAPAVAQAGGQPTAQPGRMFPGRFNPGNQGPPGVPGANGLPFPLPRRRVPQ